MSNLAKAVRNECSLEQIGPQIDLCLRKTRSCVKDTEPQARTERSSRACARAWFRNIYQSSIKYHSNTKCPDRGGERRLL